MELLRRLALGLAAMNGSTTIWKNKDLRTATKSRLVRALVFPVAIYGCETWALKNDLQQRIGAFEHWFWHRLLCLPWTAKRTNASVMEEVGFVMSLQTRITKLNLSYFGPFFQRDGLENSIMLDFSRPSRMGNGCRGKSHPRMRWLDVIREIYRSLNLQKLFTATRDRELWKRLVNVITRGRP